MSITNRLCNPTPFRVDWNYDRGVFIKLEPDGFQDLMDVEMSNQFRPGLPGTESVREEMNQFGIFLRDTAVPYELQAKVDTKGKAIEARGPWWLLFAVDNADEAQTALQQDAILKTATNQGQILSKIISILKSLAK